MRERKKEINLSVTLPPSYRSSPLATSMEVWREDVVSDRAVREIIVVIVGPPRALFWGVSRVSKIAEEADMMRTV